MAGENYVIENIKSRRSIRNFQAHPIPKEIIEKITEAGGFAPSALNRQGWKFIIIDDKKFIEQLSKIATARIKRVYRLIPLLRVFSKDLKDMRAVNALKKTAESDKDTVFYNGPLIIAIANDSRFSDTKKDCCLAAQNMMLAAHSLGVGSCFIGRARFIPKSLLLKRSGLPSFYDIDIYIAFGYPEEIPKTPPPRKEGTVKWI